MDCIVLRSRTLSSDAVISWRSLSIFRSFRYCDSVNVIYVIEFNVGKPGSGQIFEDFLYSAAQWNPILSERCQDAYQSHRIYLKAVESSEQGNCYDNAPIESFWGILRVNWFFIVTTEPRRRPLKTSRNTSRFFIVVRENRKNLAISLPWPLRDDITNNKRQLKQLVSTIDDRHQNTTFFWHAFIVSAINLKFW